MKQALPTGAFRLSVEEAHNLADHLYETHHPGMHALAAAVHDRKRGLECTPYLERSDSL